MMTQASAIRIAGTLGYPSKMPGTSYGLPATKCVTGARLAKIPGSICHVCYALKDRYVWGNAIISQARRLAGVVHEKWSDAMVALLLRRHSGPRIKIDLGITGQRLQRIGGTRYRWNESGWHRWHDSGDLQSVEHLGKICEVARRTPQIKHWLPTQELGMVLRYVDGGGKVPDNLTIRVSSVMLNNHNPRNWPHTSSVFTNGASPSGVYLCPAHHQKNQCCSCRACWSREVPHVVYAAH